MKPGHATVALLAVSAALAMAGSAGAQPEPPASPKPQPFEMVRTLQALQNQAAQGNVAAHVAQRNLLRELEGPLSEPGPAWSDPRNVRAAVLFVLSGGQPVVLRRLIDRGALSGEDTELAQGAFAYVSGDEAEARRLLMPIDAMKLPPALGAQVALVQASLTARLDSRQALRLLDQARLMAPGSLVEEASLRREVFIAGETGDLDRLEKATSQYMRRFGRSVYAENFRQSFANAVVRYEIGRDASKFPRLVATMSAFDEPVRRAVFLVIARDALIGGRHGQAYDAAVEAEKIAGPDRRAHAQARLYASAARIGSESPDASLAALARIDENRLGEADRAILRAARGIAATIKSPGAAGAGAAGLGPVAAAPRPSKEADPESRPMRLIRSAERRLEEATALLATLEPAEAPK